MKLTYVLSCLLLASSLSACEEKSKGEKLKDDLEDKAEKAEKKLEKAGDDIEDEAEKLKKKADKEN